MNILLIIFGIAAGFLIGWLFSKNKNQSSEAAIQQDYERAVAIISDLEKQL